MPFYVFTLIFVWVGVLAAILSFRVGKWIPTLGAYSRFILLGFFTLSVVIYGIKHGVHGFGGSGLTSRHYAGFVGLVPLLLFNFVGFELPNSAGDEMTNPQKDVPYAIFRSTFLSILLYGAPILGILLVLPTVRDHQPRRLHRRDQGRLLGLRRVGRLGRLGDPVRRRQRARRLRGRSCSCWRCCPPASPGSWGRTGRWPCPASTAPRRASSV